VGRYTWRFVWRVRVQEWEGGGRCVVEESEGKNVFKGFQKILEG
jgi:hypothetical protein